MGSTPAVAQWFQLCSSVPVPNVQSCVRDRTRIFTDGSTIPHKVLRKSSWAVTLTSPQSREFTVLYSVVLPGKQCNYRAELFVIFVVVQCAESADIFCDNLGVVQGFRILLTHSWVASRSPQLAETELWWEIWGTLCQKRCGWTITHVHSHTHPGQRPSGSGSQSRAAQVDR